MVEITRVNLPDEIDNEDIFRREGDVLQRSPHSRWASRLSLQVTDLITQRLAMYHPRALITDQPHAEPPSLRISVDISQLEVTSAGRAYVAADWVSTPRDPGARPLHYRREFSARGPVKTDKDVVALELSVLSSLADSIASNPIP